MSPSHDALLPVPVQPLETLLEGVGGITWMASVKMAVTS